ncbi:hypothetical protein ACFQZZ_19660 [Nocardia sp. GCM10030253]|uniref:hypothetical protein n=1 Tax=Nocardia sp. GCM10030253 TaxID=3273404 RepID=UPI0036311469
MSRSSMCGDGLAATESIVATGGTYALVLTTYDSDANRALQAGASGFLRKACHRKNSWPRSESPLAATP